MHQRGRAIEALALIERALVNRGNALISLQRPDEAVASDNRTLAVHPRDFETLVNRGNVLLRLNRPDEALADYERALALKRGFVNAIATGAMC